MYMVDCLYGTGKNEYKILCEHTVVSFISTQYSQMIYIQCILYHIFIHYSFTLIFKVWLNIIKYGSRDRWDIVWVLENFVL